jgi:hypothetical protein
MANAKKPISPTGRFLLDEFFVVSVLISITLALFLTSQFLEEWWLGVLAGILFPMLVRLSVCLFLRFVCNIDHRNVRPMTLSEQLHG